MDKAHSTGSGQRDPPHVTVIINIIVIIVIPEYLTQ